SPGDWDRQLLIVAPMGVTTTVANVDPLDGGDEFILHERGFTKPPRLLAGSIVSADTARGEDRALTCRPELLKKEPGFFNTAGMVTEQFFASSADRTQIPYFVTRRAGATGPTILRAYGGYGTSLLPEYDSAMGISWLELGGVSVVANIRGGGEYG